MSNFRDVLGSLDMSKCDFFLWGYWKQKLHANIVHIIEDFET